MSWNALGATLREVRLHMCQTGPGSAGTRDFVKSMYAKIKLANPGFPFLIREAEGTSAKITGRYDYGVESSVALEGKSSKDVEAALKKLMQAEPVSK